MSLITQNIPVQRVRARTIYGVNGNHNDRPGKLKRALAQHRYYLKNKERKAADNARRYRERKEKMDRLERELAQLRGVAT